MDFNNRVVLITGASGSLGREYARTFAARGAKLVLNDLGTTLSGESVADDALETVSEELRRAGASVVATRHDISDESQAEDFVAQATATFGRVDVLINSAGNMRNGAFKKMSAENFRRVVEVHFYGTVYLCRACFPRMIEQDYGRIILTTSAGGLYGAFGVANYGSAKTALVGLMNVLKIEGARHNILVNSIAPLASSRMMEGLLQAEVDPDLAFSPNWVSPVVLYLASDRCSESGRIIVAGAGHYARILVVQNEGVRYTAGNYPSPEEIAARFDEISEVSDVRVVNDLQQAMAMSCSVLSGSPQA